MKKLFLLLSLVFAAQISLAQDVDQATITGTILNPDGTPVEGASIALFDTTDTETITGTTSDESGNFTLEASPGEYLFKVLYVSYDDYVEEIELEAGESWEVGEITMEESAQQLDEVVVEDEQSQIEMNFDSRTFDVGQDVTSMGGTALDVLDQVPSIVTDYEGNVSLRGNDGVQVLINGRPSSLVRNGTEGLSSIPANMVEDVEIITNPSARYSAQGTAGIINIILVDDAQLGFNGSVSAEASSPQEYELGSNLNYNVGNINLFFSPNIEYENDPGSSRTFQSFNTDTTYTYNRTSDSDEEAAEGGFQLGADFFLPNEQVITAYSYVDIEWSEDRSDILNTDYDVSNGVHHEIDPGWDVLERTREEDIEEQRERNVDFNLQYENRFDGSDHRLTADASFDISRDTEDAVRNRFLEVGSGDIPNDQRSYTEDSARDFRFDVDYERPLGENGRFEAGLRSNFDWMDTDYTAEEFEDGTWVSQPGLTDNFKYMENVNALYTQLAGEAGSFTFQAGVRAENTRIQTELDATGEGSDQNYINLFPSVFLTYSFNDFNSVQLSYSRRIDRPWSRMLLPFTNIEDSRSQRVGNPNLEPEFGNSFEAGYLRHWESGSILTSVYYRYRTGVIERIERFPGDGITIRQPINLSTEEAVGVELSADQEIFSGFQLSGSANFYHTESDGEYEGETYGSDTGAFTSRLRMRWRFLDGWNFQTSMRFRSGRETSQGGERSASTFVDSGLSKDFLDDQLRVSFSINDLLNSRQWDQTIDNPNYFTRSENTWSTRSFSIDLRYNFSSGTEGGQGGDRGRGGGDWD